MMNKKGLALTALAMMAFSTAAFADLNIDDALKSLKDKVAHSVTASVNRITGNEPAEKKVTRKLEDEQWQGRFINADGTGYDVKIDLGENGLFRRLAVYGDAPNKPDFDLGRWYVNSKGQLILENTNGDKTVFNYQDKTLSLADQPKNVLQKGDFDLFHSRDFVVDVDKVLTYRGEALIKNESENAILSLAGDGTYRMALARGAKAKDMNGLWAQAHDGMIVLHDSTSDHFYIAPYKDGYVFSNSQGKNFNTEMFTRDREFNLFDTFSEGRGTLKVVDGDDLIFVTDLGFVYEVEEKESELAKLPKDQAIDVLFKVLKPASDDDLPEIAVIPRDE